MLFYFVDRSSLSMVHARLAASFNHPIQRIIDHIVSRDNLKARTETRHSKKWIALLPRTNLVRESTSNRTQVGWRGCVLQLMQGTSEGWWRLFSTFHIFHGLSNTSPRWQIELIFVLLPLSCQSSPTLTLTLSLQLQTIHLLITITRSPLLFSIQSTINKMKFHLLASVLLATACQSAAFTPATRGWSVATPTMTGFSSSALKMSSVDEVAKLREKAAAFRAEAAKLSKVWRILHNLVEIVILFFCVSFSQFKCHFG